MEGLTKNDLIEKLQRISGNPKVYVGGQYLEDNAHAVYACAIIDVEVAQIRDVAQILLIEDEE
jgi:hypothetical protein